MEQLEQFISDSDTIHNCILFLSVNICVLLHMFGHTWPFENGSLATFTGVYLSAIT